MDENSKFHRKTPRVAVAAAVATGTLTLFAVIGGVGLAQNGASAAQYQYGKKTTICHKGKKTISVGNAAVPAHLRHGDTVGACAGATAKQKAAKASANKAKAAAKAAAAGKPATPGAKGSKK